MTWAKTGSGAAVGILGQNASFRGSHGARCPGGAPSLQGFHHGGGVGGVYGGRSRFSATGGAEGGSESGGFPKKKGCCTKHSKPQEGELLRLTAGNNL